MLFFILEVSFVRAQLSVEELRCNLAQAPLAVEDSIPILSWRIKAGYRNVEQIAYHILVSDSKSLLDSNIGNIWDSGKVNSDNSFNVQYAGEELKSGNIYYWKVRIWDNHNSISEWSDVSWWRQSKKNILFNWIGFTNKTDNEKQVSSIWFRKEYVLSALSKEKVYAEISTPGYYELYINGRKVGSDVLSPSVSGKDKRIFYVVYDIGKYLYEGNNVFAIWLGKGWNGPGPIPFSFSCSIPQKNGDLKINTDSTWMCAVSGYSTLGKWTWGDFGGECYDARMENRNWNKGGLDLTLWHNAEELLSPSPSVVAQPCELNRKNTSFRCKSIKELDNSVYEIDFGKSLTGSYEVTFPKLNKGDSVKLYFADVRWNSIHPVNTPAGLIKVGGLGDRIYTCGTDTVRYITYNQRSVYIASGDDEPEKFESKFNPLGFRYIIIEGLKDKPIEVRACLIETDLRRTGYFECSDTLFMHMHKTNDWTLRCLNQGGVYVDCPTRERLGYGGDAQVSIESSVMNYYMPLFYKKFLVDWLLRQNLQSGELPNVAPNYHGGGGIGWPGIIFSLSWKYYIYYGDRTLLELSYPHLKLYLKYLDSKCKNEIYYSDEDIWQSIGDWLAPGRGMDTNNWPTIRMADFFNNCYRIYLWDIFRKISKVLNKGEDYNYSILKLADLRDLVHRTFYDEENQFYVSEEQAYLVMPLYTKVVPDSLKQTLFDRLERNILQKGTLDTGMLGTYFLIQYLIEQDRNDLLFKMFHHSRYPGWGYMLSQGATVWWEQWNGYYSQMHACFTSLDSWFYQGLAGIQPIDGLAGMKCYRIRPAYDLPINYVNGTIESMFGVVRSEWKKDCNGLNINLIVPPNTKAELWLLIDDKDKIKENCKGIDNVDGILDIRNEGKYIVCWIGSGVYSFRIDN